MPADYLHIIDGRAAYGQVSTDDLGYPCRETHGQVVVLSPASYDVAISAHAPSELRVVLEQSAIIRAATNASFCARSPSRAWIGWHHIGDLAYSSATTPAIHVPPGEYRLRFETPTMPGSHTLWLIGPSDKPPTGRVALVTCGFYPHDELADKLRRLFRSAALRGMLVHVVGVGEHYRNHTWGKAIRMREELACLPAAYDWVVYTDGCDSFMVGDENDIMAQLASIPRGTIVMSAEDACWPVRDELWAKAFTEPHGLPAKLEGPHLVDGRPIHVYPCAGQFAGRKEDVLEALATIERMADEIRRGEIPICVGRENRPANDQYVWQVAMMTGRLNVQLDIHWRLFAQVSTVHRWPTRNRYYRILPERGGLSFIACYNNRPALVHNSGPGKRWLHMFDGLIESPRVSPDPIRHFATRRDMLALVQPGGVVAEIGVFRGDFAQEILDVVQPSKLCLVDRWMGLVESGDKDGRNSHAYDGEELYRLVVERFASRPEVRIYRDDSLWAMRSMHDRTFDAIYIDAGHGYDEVIQELHEAARLVKIGGWIMGHDYHPFCEVWRAVHDFCREHSLAVAAVADDECPSFAIRLDKG
jgi:hypothetical protein